MFENDVFESMQKPTDFKASVSDKTVDMDRCTKRTWSPIYVGRKPVMSF